MNIVCCKVCETPSKYVIQSINLAYYYCEGCEKEVVPNAEIRVEYYQGEIDADIAEAFEKLTKGIP